MRNIFAWDAAADYCADELVDAEDRMFMSAVLNSVGSSFKERGQRIEFVHASDFKIHLVSPIRARQKCAESEDRNVNGMLGLWTTITTDVPHSTYGKFLYKGTVDLWSDRQLGTITIEELAALNMQSKKFETREEQIQFYLGVEQEWRRRGWRVVVVKEPRCSIMIVLNEHVITEWQQISDAPQLDNRDLISGIMADRIPINYADGENDGRGNAKADSVV